MDAAIWSIDRSTHASFAALRLLIHAHAAAAAAARKVKFIA